jgi:biopolymer transport protein ExbD
MIKRFDEINVVPLLDVMLVLLAMVLITATFVVDQQLDVELATSQTGSAVESQQQRLSLVLDAQGQLQVAGEVMPIAALRQRLLSVSRDTAMDVYIDRACPFGSVVAVLDVLQTLSFSYLAVHTQPQKR